MISSFKYTQDPSADEPVMFIDAEIGTGIDPDNGKPRVDGNDFKKELLYLDSLGKKRIRIYINSMGGVVTEGMAIFSGIQKCKATIDTYCYGYAYSIAAIIFEGATGKRIMDDWTSLMFHKPYRAGDEEMTKSDKEMLEVITNGCKVMIAEKTGKSMDDVDKLFKRDTYFTPKEAKDNGFCDEIVKTQEVKNLSGLTDNEKWKRANKIYNRFNDNKMTNENEIICKKLKLNVNTSAEGIAEAVESVIAKAKKDGEEHEGKIKDLMDRYEAKMKECDDLKAEMETMKAKAKKEMEDKKIKDEEEMDAKAEKELKDAVNAGKIKADAVPTFKAQFKTDFEGTKKILDAIAPTKQAPRFEGNEDLTPFQRAWNTMKSADVNNRLKVGDSTYYALKKQYQTVK
jgi:ATP-dependent Clp protease, protease subunit